MLKESPRRRVLHLSDATEVMQEPDDVTLAVRGLQHEAEARESWRKAWTRSFKLEPEKHADYTFTRWLAPSIQARKLDGSFKQTQGVRNAWQRYAWEVETRTRWWDLMPRSKWREKKVELCWDVEEPNRASDVAEQSGRQRTGDLRAPRFFDDDADASSEDLSDGSSSEPPLQGEAGGNAGSGGAKQESQNAAGKTRKQSSRAGQSGLKTRKTLTEEEQSRVSVLIAAQTGEKKDHDNGSCEVMLLHEVTSSTH